MKIKKLKKLDFPVVTGTDKELLEWAISTVGNALSKAYTSEKAFETFQNLIEKKLSQSPMVAIKQRMEELTTRITHLEAGQSAKELFSPPKPNKLRHG